MLLHRVCPYKLRMREPCLVLISFSGRLQNKSKQATSLRQFWDNQPYKPEDRAVTRLLCFRKWLSAEHKRILKLQGMHQAMRTLRSMNACVTR
jgi:hypothetical protein